ncbi:MAG: quinone oxidoreductase [Rhodobacteraceae bacterium]|nr:quinone oxidoreductase [Paracoccaceae bacterium]
MAHAIRAARPGGPEVLERIDFAPPDPGPGEIRIRQTAIGVNFIDVYFRRGLYPWPDPARGIIPGGEGAGIVEAVGAGVAGLSPGQRVAWTLPHGGYASHRLIPAAQAVVLPDDIGDETAAAVMLKGLTVHYLIHDSYPVRAGDSVLVHAAAGGVGLLACQWLAHRGVRVIATAGGAEKCALARAHGAAEAIDYRAGDFLPRVLELTGGKGVAAVYDGVGADTILGSVAALATFGTLVSFGQSSGQPDALRIAHLARASLRLQRPSLFNYTARPGWLAAAAADLFAAVGSGAIAVRVGEVRPLAEVARVHEALEGRRTTGATVLRP